MKLYDPIRPISHELLRAAEEALERQKRLGPPDIEAMARAGVEWANAYDAQFRRSLGHL